MTANEAPVSGLTIVAPLPPPYGGQTLMVERLVDSVPRLYRGIDVQVVPVQYSHNLADTGRFSVRKVAHLVALTWRVWRGAGSGRRRVLYYTPAGPTMLAVLRDLFFLSLVRRRFRKVVFHLHAGGVGTMYGSVPAMLRPLFRFAYWRPDLTIRVAVSAPADHLTLRSKASVVVPNGVADLGGPKEVPQVFSVLFVGLVCRSKGAGVLIEAVAELRRHRPVQLHIVGERQDRKFQRELETRIRELGLEPHVTFHGVLRGEELQALFNSTHVFAFPTFFESETFGLVVAEAMSAGLPVVATDWRGVSDVVEHGRTGFLIPPRDAHALAERLSELALDPALAARMGQAGRQSFEERFTVEKHVHDLRRALELVIREEV